jgi:hypothetical protein
MIGLKVMTQNANISISFYFYNLVQKQMFASLEFVFVFLLFVITFAPIKI